MTELQSSTITEPSPTLCSPRCLPYLHNPGFQLLHRFWLFVLHSGTHHLLLHHAVLVQRSLVLVQYPLLVPFTQVLYGKRKQQVRSGSQESANTAKYIRNTHVWSHLVSFLCCRFLLLCFQEGQKMPAAKKQLLEPRPVSLRGDLEHHFCQHFGSYQASCLF